MQGAGPNCSLSSTGRVQVISNTPESWGYVATEPISLAVDATTTVEVKIDSVDAGANYTLVIKDISQGNPQPEYVFASQRTSVGTHMANLSNAFGQTGNRIYLIYIWVGGGEGRGVQVDYVRVYTNQGGLAVDYVYDGVGRRIQKSVNGTITKFIYDREHIIEEHNSTNQLQIANVFGLNIDEILQTTVYQPTAFMYYYNSDHLGSITELTDQAGAVIEKYEYDPFGKPTILNTQNSVLNASTVGNRYMFTGREWDGESGLYYYRARYYDSKIGRFISADQIGFKGGVNFYIYVSNNPVNWLDPWGLCRETGGHETPEDYYDPIIDIANEVTPDTGEDRSNNNQVYDDGWPPGESISIPGYGSPIFH